MSRPHGAATSKAASAGSWANGASRSISTSSRSTSICRNSPSAGTEEENTMTYYGGKDLAAAFRTVRENTVKIAEEIPEEKYDFRATPDTKTIGQTLAHIGISSGFQYHIHSNKVTDMKTVNF